MTYLSRAVWGTFCSVRPLCLRVMCYASRICDSVVLCSAAECMTILHRLQSAPAAPLTHAGGDYLFSAPLVIPSSYFTFRIHGGTLGAGSGFAADRYLIQVGTPGSTG